MMKMMKMMKVSHGRADAARLGRRLRRQGDGRRRALALRDAVQAARLLVERDVDGAALLADGLLRRILALALCEDNLAPLAPAEVLRRLDAAPPALAVRLRLAVRAPSLEARLAHYARLVDALASGMEAHRARNVRGCRSVSRRERGQRLRSSVEVRGE